MKLPERMLSDLARWILNAPAQRLATEPPDPIGFQIPASRWSCLLSDSGFASWYFRPFERFHPNELDHATHASKDPLPSKRDSTLESKMDWKLDATKTQRLRIALSEISRKQRVEDPSDQFCLIQFGPWDAILGRCDGLHLVANSLQSWGPPPPSILTDWQRQREAFSPHNLCNTAETFVDDRGRLLPIQSVIRLFENSSARQSPLSTEPPVASSMAGLASRFPIAPGWPTEDAAGDANASLESQPISRLAVSAFDMHVGKRGKRRRTRPTRRLLAGVGTALSVLALLAAWLLWGQQGRGPETADQPLPAIAEHPNTPALNRSKQVSPQAMSDQDVDSIPFDSRADSNIATDSSSDAGTDADLSIESLRQQLQHGVPMRGDGTLPALGSLSASAIIEETLGDAKVFSQEVPEALAENDDAPEVLPDLSPFRTPQSEPGIARFEFPLHLKMAFAKTLVPVGKPVVAKDCLCEIELKPLELKTPGKLIVEPQEAVVIEGVGKQIWRIAIEDQEPELRMEIGSKPGSRWQIIAMVGLLEHADSQPVLIGPRDAQIVGNRLIEYRQWADRSIEMLRQARADRQGKSTTDLTVEIKKWEAQKREADKAIDRWKVIARLGHLFFDQVEVHVRLSAVEKP